VTLEIDVLTLFPAMIAGPLAESIPGRIQEQGLATIRIHDLREFGLGRHKSVDDTPYGGGAGMVMRVEPLVAAIESVRRPDSTVILLDPAGEVFRHERAADLALRGHLVFICARYEGVDERIRAFVDLELSIGDYVLTGGELPALVVISATRSWICSLSSAPPSVIAQGGMILPIRPHMIVSITHCCVACRVLGSCSSGRLSAGPIRPWPMSP